MESGHTVQCLFSVGVYVWVQRMKLQKDDQHSADI